MKIRLNNVRLAFPALFEPEQVKPTDTPKFKAAFLMEPDHPDVKKLEKAMAEVAKEKWAAKAKEVHKSLKASDRLALHDGDTKAQCAGYDGNLFVNANNELKVPVLDTNPKNTVSPQDGKIYPGAFVNALIDVWAQDNQYGKRINAALMGVQFTGHGERLAGSGVASEDDFDALPDAEDAGDAFGSDDAEAQENAEADASEDSDEALFD